MAMAASRPPESPFALAFEQLAANGYHVLPISPHSKAPSEYRGGRWFAMRDWQRYRDTPANQFLVRAWCTWPNCNIGIVTGTRATASQVVACVDFDTDDPDILLELQRALPVSPVAKKGRRGHSAFYLVPNGTTGFRTAIVELLTDTRQTVVPPSIHPDTGRPYQWTGSKTLIDTAAKDLPALSEDDLARFRDTVEALTERPLPAASPVVIQFPDGGETVWRRLNNTAFANLDAWVPELGLPKLRKSQHGYQAVAHWRASSRGRPIEQRNPNLSIMTGRGARDFGTGQSLTALDLVQAALGIELDDAFAWLGSRLGVVEQKLDIAPPVIEQASCDRASPDVKPAQTTNASFVEGEGQEASGEVPPHDPGTGELLPEPLDADELPDEFTRVPGLLGDVVDWIADGARRPNRTLALGAALTIVGTAIGQAVAGPTGSATHLYVVALAPSGAGKDHPLQSISRLLKAANSGSLIGPSEFISMPAVIKFLTRKPLAVCAMDEIGAFLKRLVHPRASAYEKAISKVLRSVWGINFESMMTPEWASVAATEIVNPALSIYGVSTPGEFFSALEGDDVVNGFLNRWLLLTTNRKIRDRDPLHPPGHVPPDLALGLAQLRNEAHALTEADRKAPIGDGKAIKRMVWNGGRGAYEALLNDVERVCRDEDLAPYYARTAEMAVRLATIAAAGRGTMQVGADDMLWGRNLAWWSANRMAALAGSYIAENDAQRMHNRVMRIICSRGGKVSHRDIVRALKGAMSSRGLKDVMDQMLASGDIVSHRSIPPAGGPPTITYEVRRG